MAIYEGAAIFLFAHFMKGSTKQERLHCSEGGAKDNSDDDESSDGTLRSYVQVYNHLLQTYADDGIIYATNAASSKLK